MVGTSVLPALRKLRKDNHKFKTSLVSTVSSKSALTVQGHAVKKIKNKIK